MEHVAGRDTRIVGGRSRSRGNVARSDDDDDDARAAQDILHKDAYTGVALGIVQKVPDTLDKPYYLSLYEFMLTRSEYSRGARWVLIPMDS
jgi:hypothetical protein